MTTLRTRARSSSARTFASLGNRNYRLFFGGQAVSLVGTWMYAVAQGWLVYTLTDSGTWVGLLVAAQTLPVLFLGPYGGLVADRMDKRRLLIGTQLAKSFLGLVLGVLTVSEGVRLWMVLVLALFYGLTNVFDNPARQTFMPEIVGRDLLGNAVSLNSILVNAARAVGPAVAGILIVTVGVGTCFLVDAASYVAVVCALLLMDTSKLQPTEPQPRAKGQVREGLRYVRHTPNLLVPLLMMTLVGTFAYEFQVSLPVFARETFDGNADTYGFLTAAMGVGAVIGGLEFARRGRWGVGPLLRATAIFGGALLATALAPTLWVAVVLLMVVGATSIGFLAGASTTLQLTADPQMRGRVMSLWAVAFLGTTPIGGPIIGWVAQHAGGRWSLAVGGAAALIAAAMGRALLRDRGDDDAERTTARTEDRDDDELGLEVTAADDAV